MLKEQTAGRSLSDTNSGSQFLHDVIVISSSSEPEILTVKHHNGSSQPFTPKSQRTTAARTLSTPSPHHTLSFSGPHVSWDVSTHRQIAGRLESNNSESSPGSSQDGTIATIVHMLPSSSQKKELFYGALKDPETDLFAKFAPPSFSNESAVAKLPSRPGALSRSISASGMNSKKRSLQSGSGATGKRTLIRHATSPAMLNCQQTKMSMILNLASPTLKPESIELPKLQDLVPSESKVDSLDGDTLEDTPTIARGIPKSKGTSSTMSIKHEDNLSAQHPFIQLSPHISLALSPRRATIPKLSGDTDHLFRKLAPRVEQDSRKFDEALEALFDQEFGASKTENTPSYAQAAKETTIVINNNPDNENIEEFFDSDFSFDDELINEMKDQTKPTAKPTSTEFPLSQTHIHSSLNNLNPPSYGRRKVYRFVVKEVVKQTFIENDGDLESEEVILVLEGDKTIRLRDNWLDCVPLPGAVINFVGELDLDAVIDNTQNILVVEPDQLVTCTAVAESFYCRRKTVLQNRLRSAGDTNSFLVYGSMIHEIFQLCLAVNTFTPDFIKSKITVLVQEFLEQLFICDITVEEAIEYLYSKIAQICEWGRKFIRKIPESYVEEHRSRTQQRMSVSNIVDVEEEIWSPKYGLKGKIDVTVETCLHDAVRKWKLLSPMEIKSSVNTRSVSHRAQTTLYTLLLSDRYDIDIKHGILVYSETGETIRIPGIASEIRDLMIQRNLLAVAFKERETLPPMINNQRLCHSCDCLDVCTIFEYAETNKKPSVGETLPTLKTSHLEFFNYWKGQLAKEELSVKTHQEELWTLTSRDREAVGRCFGGVKVNGKLEEVQLSEVNSVYIYTMVRDGNEPFDMNAELTPGDSVIVSDERGHIFLASGYLRDMTATSLTISVNRRLTDSLQKVADHNENYNQSYNSLMHSIWEGANTQTIATTFRIDKNEWAQNMNIARSNISMLMYTKHLSTIVDLKPPRFSPSTAISALGLNSDQVSAVEKALAAKDYALILGMAGTGKTTVLATIIERLVAQGRTVLFSSYTNSAIDSLVHRIKGSGFSILRLGNQYAVHPDVYEFLPGDIETKTEFDEVYMSRPVVATTCFGVTHWLFARRTFDYCIIDEASQISLPVSLGPIQYANKFILAGDPAKNDESLFQHLSKAHSKATISLDYQYRMCADITEMLNKVVYNGRLKCGSKQVADQTLSIPVKKQVDGWLSEILNEK